MNINKLLIVLLIASISTNIAAQTPPRPQEKLTLEQKIVLLLQKLHLGNRPMLVNSVIAIVPPYYLSNNIVDLFNCIAQEFPQLDLQPLPTSDVSIALALQTSTMPAVNCPPCVELPPAIPAIEPSKTEHKCITPFFFGAMTAGMILAHVVNKMCTGQ